MNSIPANYLGRAGGGGGGFGGACLSVRGIGCWLLSKVFFIFSFVNYSLTRLFNST